LLNLWSVLHWSKVEYIWVLYRTCYSEHLNTYWTYLVFKWSKPVFCQMVWFSVTIWNPNEKVWILKGWTIWKLVWFSDCRISLDHFIIKICFFINEMVWASMTRWKLDWYSNSLVIWKSNLEKFSVQMFPLFRCSVFRWSLYLL
jgi:hypothetical protein